MSWGAAEGGDTNSAPGWGWVWETAAVPAFAHVGKQTRSLLISKPMEFMSVWDRKISSLARFCWSWCLQKLPRRQTRPLHKNISAGNVRTYQTSACTHCFFGFKHSTTSNFPVERWNPGVLPQHQDASGGLQVGPAHRCQHAGGALQPQADPRVLWPGRGHLLFWPSGRKIKLFSVTGALIVANFCLVMPRVQPKRQICTSGVGGGGFRSYSGLKEILLPHKKS